MAVEQKCLIWGTPAKVEETDGGIVFYSPRAGGKYRIDVSASNELLKNPLNVGEKIKLTDWLIIRRRIEPEIPIILPNVFEAIKGRFAQTMQDRIDELMRLLSGNYKVGDLVEIKNDDAEMMLMAYSSSSEVSEVFACLRYCGLKGYLEGISRESRDGSHWNTRENFGGIMTVAGKMYAEKIGR